MKEILEQLELNETFFIQLGIVVFLFFVLKVSFFKPFLNLFKIRHQKTVEDKQAAEKLLAEANRKLEEYQKQLAAAKSEAQTTYENILMHAKKEETEIFSKAREEAKKINQDAAAEIFTIREKLKKDLEADVNVLAQRISDQLLQRRD